MLDEYTRRRFDRAAEDIAVVRTKVESIEKSLAGFQEQFDSQQTRLGRVERRLFAVWIIGPILVAVAGYLKSIQNSFTGS